MSDRVSVVCSLCRCAILESLPPGRCRSVLACGIYVIKRPYHICGSLGGVKAGRNLVTKTARAVTCDLVPKAICDVIRRKARANTLEILSF